MAGIVFARPMADVGAHAPPGRPQGICPAGDGDDAGAMRMSKAEATAFPMTTMRKGYHGATNGAGERHGGSVVRTRSSSRATRRMKTVSFPASTTRSVPQCAQVPSSAPSTFAPGVNSWCRRHVIQHPDPRRGMRVARISIGAT